MAQKLPRRIPAPPPGKSLPSRPPPGKGGGKKGC